MAKIVREKGVPYLRDADGRNAAIVIGAPGKERVWISNRAVRAICFLITMSILAATGTLKEAAASTGQIAWVLRGALK